MEQQQTEFLGRLVEYGGYAFGAVATALMGGMWRRYSKDRSRLANLERQMKDLADMRTRTDDGRKPIDGLQAMEERLNTLASALDDVVIRQDASDRQHTDVLLKLTAIENDVSWIRDAMQSNPHPRRRPPRPKS